MKACHGQSRNDRTGDFARPLQVDNFRAIAKFLLRPAKQQSIGATAPSVSCPISEVIRPRDVAKTVIVQRTKMALLDYIPYSVFVRDTELHVVERIG